MARRLSRMNAWPGCRPVISTQRDGAQHVVAGVVRRQTHPLGGQPVDVGRADFLLAVAAQVAVAQVVGEDEDDVRLAARRRGRHHFAEQLGKNQGDEVRRVTGHSRCEMKYPPPVAGSPEVTLPPQAAKCRSRRASPLLYRVLLPIGCSTFCPRWPLTVSGTSGSGCTRAANSS